MTHKIYLASSWRNEQQPDLIEWMRDAGLDVYDFRNPEEGNTGFHWSEIDEDYKSWDSDGFIEGLGDDIARQGFKTDMKALEGCETCVLLLPSGRSAHLELGWAAGAGKNTAIYMPKTGFEVVPELMYSTADIVTNDLDDLMDFCRDA